MSLVRALFLLAITEVFFQMRHNSWCLHSTSVFKALVHILLTGSGLNKKIYYFLEKLSQEREVENNLPALVQWCLSMNCVYMVLPWLLSGKESTCNEGDAVRSLGQEDPLEIEMATCSSILAWKIPWTGESSGLQSVGLAKSWTWLLD